MRLRLSTPGEVRKSLSKIANMVANGQMDAKMANTLILACNAILGSIRTDDQQKKIDEFERWMNEQKERRR